MGIYQKTKNILGKITLIIMTAIFPFVIFVHTNKNLILCNVFIIISFLGVLFTIANEFMYNRCTFKNFLLSRIKSEYIVPCIMILAAVLCFFIRPLSAYQLNGIGSRIQGILFFIGCAFIYIVIYENYVYEEIDMMLMVLSSIIINIVFVCKALFFQSENAGVYAMYAGMMLAVCLYSYICSDDKKRVYYAIAMALSELGIIVSNREMAVIGMAIIILIMMPVALKKYERFTKYCLSVLMVFILGRLMGYVNIFMSDNALTVSGLSAFLLSYKTNILIIAGCIIYMGLIFFDDRIRGIIRKIDRSCMKKIYICCIGLMAAAVMFLVMWNNYKYNYTFNLMMLMGIFQILMGVIVIVNVIYKVIESIRDRNTPHRSSDYENDDILLEGYGSRYMITAIGMAAIAYILQGTGNLFEFAVFPVFICFTAIMSTYNKNCGS